MTVTTPPPRTRARTQQRAPQRTVPAEPAGSPRTAPAVERPRARSAASQRAYARKAQRHIGSTGARADAPARRAPFVLLVMVLLAAGLVASLWLSTAAAGDSYRLEQARQQARDLSERSEQLRQEVASLQTAPELARRARDLGMVPTGEPARLVGQPDGTVLVVGKPSPATAPPPPAPPPADQSPAAGQPPAGGQPPAAGQPPAPVQGPVEGQGQAPAPGAGNPPGNG